MGYLATGNAGKTGYFSFFLLIFLMPIVHLKAQTDAKHLLVIINKSDRKVQINEARESDIYQRHQENLQRLLNGGYLSLIGFPEKGGGIFIGNESDRIHIQAILEGDRIIDSGIFVYQIKVFDKEAGHVCRFKKGCNETNYQLIKFLSNLNKETVKIAATMEYQHQLYLEKAYPQDLILLAGKFEGKDGGFVIYRGEDFKNFVYNDPAIINDYFVAEFLSFIGCDRASCLEP